MLRREVERYEDQSTWEAIAGLLVLTAVFMLVEHLVGDPASTSVLIATTGLRLDAGLPTGSGHAQTALKVVLAGASVVVSALFASGHPSVM